MNIRTYNTCVVGSGAAGFSAAIRLKQLGVDSVAVVTEGVKMGTSRNTGSDKQTYYKLGLGGDCPDSVADMAKDLFAGGCVDGDNALVEAALSARCFLHLCELGVPFPTNRYGEYVGYKTDHDPRARATSVGPLTSREMTQRLQARAEELEIPILDRQMVVSVLQSGGRAAGLLALDKDTEDFVVYCCKNIVWATGGPGGIYEDSVYPACHTGSSGVLFETGILTQNLTQWQYGLASVQPRWNVSGTYMQVLPRFFSVGEDGEEHEFLRDFFKDPNRCLSMVFLKGYQWPFDSKKVLNGSSVIDLLVYRETVLRGRRVYLDYRVNPLGEEPDYKALSREAREYLEQAGACFGTPIQRLAHMNQPAIDLYASKGVDLYTQPLEIALCAQHHNGGAAVDCWWQSSLKGLFVCGEAAGTHGVTRPGGSALNAGQVGALRAAQYIAAHGGGEPEQEGFAAAARQALDFHRAFLDSLRTHDGCDRAMLTEARKRMSALGGPIRTKENLTAALRATEDDLQKLHGCVGAQSRAEWAYRLRDALLCQRLVLSAMADHMDRGLDTEGSALYYDTKGSLPEGLEERFRFTPAASLPEKIQQARMTKAGCTVTWRDPRPLPEGGGVFETVWREFRSGNVGK